MENKKEQPLIIINGEGYSMVNVTKEDGELIASIGSEGLIEAVGFKIDLIKDSHRIRFSDIPN